MPYRNSIMTMVLRDSLGGNCRTVMVATMSSDAAHMDESISTCKFAQRVAMIRNEVLGRLVLRLEHLTLGQNIASYH